MLVWNEAFATGLETLDQQHKVLIDHINRLGEMLSHSHPTPAEMQFAHSIVQFLDSYADTHFKFEENCMERYRCPSHAQNLDAHAQFMKFLDDFKHRFQNHDNRMEAFRELHQTMSTWITGHILRIDTQLKACVKH